MQIYISGSLAFDRIMTFPGKFSDHILPDKIHILNVCFLVDGLEEKFGGTAGNIAYSLALMEEKPTILCAVGKDFGAYDARLQQLALPVAGIRTIDHEFTAGAYITTDMSDNQITGFNPGAMKHSSGFDMNNVIKETKPMGIISPGNLEDMMNHPQFYRDNNIPFIFDPGQQITAFNGEQLAKALEGAEILITNDYELEMIMNATKYSLEDILDKVDTVITTLGEEGSLIRKKGEDEIKVPVAKPGEVLDPTGAGDAYRAGLLKGMSLGYDLPKACRMGAVCSAYAIEKKGTQEHSFNWEEFVVRYEENFGSM